METKELNVSVREGVGKGIARRLRMEQAVPAIFYGPHVETPVPLAIAKKELLTAMRAGSNTLLKLRAEGKGNVDGKTALMKNEQLDPVTHAVIHVDLYEVRMDQKIKVSVPVLLVGKAKGVIEGGILDQVSRELEVRCLPTNIPQTIEADVSNLDIGDSLHLSDIKLPDGVEAVGDVNYTLAAVVTPEAEVVATPAAPVAGAEGVAAAPGAEGAAPAAAAGTPAAGAEGAKAQTEAAAKGKDKGGEAKPSKK